MDQGVKLIFSSKFDHSQLSVANCGVNILQYDIKKVDQDMSLTLSLVMMQNSCFKVIFTLPAVKNCSLLTHFGQVCSFLTFCENQDYDFAKVAIYFD